MGTTRVSTPVPKGSALPQLQGARMVTDGGLETDLIFHRGVDLPAFAAYPLLADERGRALLTDYYDAYADVAAEAGAGLLLEAPTWRANPDWGARLGHGAADLDRANRSAVELLQALQGRYASRVEGPVLVSGQAGPRGDGYVVGERMSADEAADYHRPQLASFAGAGADLVTALTLTYPDEAVGVVLAARDVGLPGAVSFTVETDGRLPDGHRLDEAVAAVDAAAPPDYFLVNCAHPDHVLAGLAPGPWRERIVGTRVNASRQSHAELDAADALDEGDPADLAAAQARLSAELPSLAVLGGCCGTDARHVRAMWQRWSA
ncbi:homocysteine S-methyltransferase family protein [Microlunatus flavus]|uniref:Homocysteine S-methyltransferase n=1 Tax=Microlunatus flavus TaxID=1036181 RepID=A0A1H9GFK2_9ACTN|nr:homocysteine S-methyltransferase family protein [Microlunatus flavus]SEQ48866.1 homocysteine S-methyltransferase [Microlunatus flavus]